MATNWQVSGQYFETCSCDYLCPCIYTNLAGRPTQDGVCTFAFVFHIDRGRYGKTALDGLNFAVIANCPGPTMADGNIVVGMIVDERASAEQQEALTQIGSGQGGGPMAALGPLVTQFLGVEAKAIRFQMDGLSRSVSIPGVLDQAIQGVPGANPDEPLYIDNAGHPVNSQLALAMATRSHIHAFGVDWDDTSGQTNGHFASFNWQA